MQEKHNIPKNNPFKVPDGYFEELTHNIQAECYQEEQNFWQAFQLQRWATALAIIAVFYLGTQNFDTETLEPEDIYAFVEKELMNWEEHLLYEYVDYTEEQNDYIDYLLEEDIELTSILNEL